MEMSISEILKNYKECNSCFETKLKTDFYNKRPECKICMKRIAGKYYHDIKKIKNKSNKANKANKSSVNESDTSLLNDFDAVSLYPHSLCCN